MNSVRETKGITRLTAGLASWVQGGRDIDPPGDEAARIQLEMGSTGNSEICSLARRAERMSPINGK